MSEPDRVSPRTLPDGTLVRLRAQLNSLETILAGATEAKLARRPDNGKWSAREHLAHLGRYHEVFLGRLERILTEESPQLGRYRTEDDPGAAKWFGLPTTQVLERMSKLRAQLIERIAELTADDLRRKGVHPAFGEMSLTLWVEFFLVHEGHHLYAILKLARERD